VEHFVIPLDCAQDFLAQRVLMFWSLITFLKIDNKSQTQGMPTRKKSEWTLVEGNKGNKNGGKKKGEHRKQKGGKKKGNIGNKKGKKRE
jgi:hypothetical protein